jgi:TonB family protein
MAVRENEVALEERKESLPAAGPPAAAPPRPAATRPAAPEDATGNRDVALEQDQQNKTVPSAAKQKAASKKSEAAGAARYQTSSAESGPEGGWEAFRTYLYSTARLSPEARNNNVSGQVTLQLTLGPNGEVEDVKVIKGLGYGCDEAAIRLARSWKWIRGAQPRVTFDVPFVR